ncbi:hypothetical protein [Sphingorhabdus sp.]|uniref:hypothetical protein n=1 Tax=Sphingorhabdus sp. TaxID=1902408 RepID=UPI00391AF501
MVGYPLKTRPLGKGVYDQKFGRNAGVARRNAAVRSAIANDLNLFRSLARFATANKAIVPVIPHQPGLFSVWGKTGQQYLQRYPGQKLGKWRAQTEFLKLLLCSQVVLEYKGYSFTVKVNEALEEMWKADEAHIYNCIKRRIRAELVSHGFCDVGMAYVLEGKGRKGSRTRLHLHGMVCGIDQCHLRAFKLAMESALEVGFRRRGKGSGLDFHCVLYYDEIVQGVANEAANWPNYCAKSLMIKDARLPGQRMFINHRLREMTKRLWGVITDAPLGKE